MTVRILPLRDRPGALTEIGAWQFAEWGHLYPEDTLESWTRGLQAQLGGQGIPTVLLAEDETGRPLGTASLIAHDIDGDLRTPWLASVFVAPAARGRGIASALVSAVERLATKLGVERLYLFTTKQERLYAGLGWEKLERCDYRGEMIQVMSKTLR
jgi:GNAT superfamily N-acetyltransferase